MSSSFLKNQLNLLADLKEMKRRKNHWSLKVADSLCWLLVLNLAFPIGSVVLADPGSKFISLVGGALMGAASFIAMFGLLVWMEKIVYKCLGLNSKTSLKTASCCNSEKKLNLIEKLEKHKPDLDPVIFENIIKVVAEKDTPYVWWNHLEEALVLVEKEAEGKNVSARQKANDELLLAKVKGLSGLALEQDQSPPLPTAVILSTEKTAQ